AWNLLSRLTGLARVLILGGALGATRLGDTYQGSNQLSNVLFEVLVAGTLSAVIVPGLVTRLTQRDVADARAFAGLVLGRVLLAIVPIVALGLLFAEPLIRLVFIGNDGPTRDAQVRLGVFLLFFVLPQLALYAWGALVAAMLHAAGRFAAAAIAPVANNLVVIAGLGLFWARGYDGLGLSLVDKWLLGSTALGGVLAMTLVPAFAAWRAGLSVVPRLGGRGESAGIGSDVAWASLVVLPAQVVALASIVVASRSSGGVAAYQIGFMFFLLPHALVGHPTATVLYPRLAAAWSAGDRATVRLLGESGLEVVGAVLFFAAACAAALAPWLVQAIALGQLDREAGSALTATALAWLAVGLPAYAATLLLTRVAYAASDLRLPARAALVGALAAGAVLVMAGAADGDRRTVALVSAAHSVMVVVTAAYLLVGSVGAGVLSAPLARLARYAAMAAIAGGAARLVAHSLPDSGGRFAAIGVVVTGGAVAVVTYVVGLVASGQRSVPRLVTQQ
ncbi:MAG: lipid II flippase MurJ, partial [Acidimicrobiales bacterium]|nr:lipid II flippase MurJ [Acidimicrobiales bacterium]